MGNRRAREFMIQTERRALWEQVQTRARDLIEDVTFPGIGIRRVQLVLAPSFEPGFAWDIRVFGDAEWWLFRSRLTELTEESVFEPTRLLGYERLDVSGDTLRACFDRLQSLTLPIGPLTTRAVARPRTGRSPFEPSAVGMPDLPGDWPAPQSLAGTHITWSVNSEKWSGWRRSPLPHARRGICLHVL
jgi:hypothetical protein